MGEELEVARRSAKASEEEMVVLCETIRKLSEELTSAKKKSSEAEKLLDFNKEEKANLLAWCDKIEREAHTLVGCPVEVSPEVLQKNKDDYLASKEFRDEKIECAMDGFFQGFDECVHQVKELDPNFGMAHLKRGDKSEGEEEEEKEEAEK